MTDLKIASETSSLLEKKTCSAEHTVIDLPQEVEESAYPHETLGYMLLFGSAIASSITQLIVHFVTSYHSFPVSAAALSQGVQQAATALFCLWYLDIFDTLKMTRRELGFVALRGFLGGSAMNLSFLSLSMLPLGIETSIFFLNPIFTLFLSSQFLGETFGTRELVAGAVSFFGVILVSNPTLSLDMSAMQDKTYAFGCAVATLSAFSASAAYTTLRSYSGKIHFLVSVLSIGIWNMILGVTFGGLNIGPLLEFPVLCGMVVLGGSCAVVSQLFLNSGFKYSRAGTGTMIGNVKVPIAYLLGLVLLNEVPHIGSLIGSTLVVGGTMIVYAKDSPKK